MMFVPSFVKIRQLVQKLLGARSDLHYDVC